MSPSAGVDLTFPMTVKTFLANADRFLNRGDILLSRSPLLASGLIRLTSGSYFSHSAMVFLTPNPAEGYGNTFVIESLFKGVGLANLETYIGGRKPIEEVGVLRLEGKGFDKLFFKHANGLMLNEVNKPYDYHRFLRIALSILFGLQSAIKRARRRPGMYRRWMPRQFICSGFIQYGLYQAAVAAGVDPERVVLKNGVVNPSPDEMMGTTPEDMATSDKLTWKYVIRRGYVHEVASYEEAKRVIGQG